MKQNELQLAKTALRVLPEADATEFERWYLETGRKDEQEHTNATPPPFAISNYDLASNLPLTFPSGYEDFQAIVLKHLTQSPHHDQWGLLHDDVIVMRISDQPSSQSGRLILLTTEYFALLLKKLFPTANITQAERQTLIQVLIGNSLKEAAEQNQVSYETKKTQLKAVFEKTNIRSQPELSRFLLAHITLEVAAQFSRRGTDVERDAEFFNFVDLYMGDYVRASVVQEPANKRYRIIEIGDPAGTPIVCVHHLGVLSYSANDIATIRELGIRLICPLRHGALGPRDHKMSAQEYTQHALGGIDLALSLADDSKAILMSLLSGCYYAMKYVELYPDKVDHLLFVGASFKPQVPQVSASTFKRNLHNLAFSSEPLLSATVAFMLRRASRADQLRKVWETSLNHGAADMQIVAETFADTRQVESMQYRLRKSPGSIARDLQTQAVADWTHLSSDAQHPPISFIHGSDDALIPIDGIAQLAESLANGRLYRIEGAGNWLFGSRSQQVLAVIKDIASNANQQAASH